VWHPKQDNDSAELEKSGQEWIIVYALVQRRIVIDALQEREVFLRGIADVFWLVKKFAAFIKHGNSSPLWQKAFHWITSITFII
jgi:hypothetical protein